jgi:hypothetical protein
MESKYYEQGKDIDNKQFGYYFIMLAIVGFIAAFFFFYGFKLGNKLKEEDISTSYKKGMYYAIDSINRKNNSYE